jgi:hypothetical protein
MIELYKKLIYLQRIKVLVLNKPISSSIKSVDYDSYYVLEDEQRTFLIKFPDEKKIRFITEKYKRGLRGIVTSDTRPDESLTNHQSDFNEQVSMNFYPWADGEYRYQLNRYAELATIESDKDLFEDPIIDWLGPPADQPIHVALEQYGGNATILKELSNYYNFLCVESYFYIIDAIDQLLNKQAESKALDEKIETNLTAPELALFFRLLGDSDKLRFENKNDLYRKVIKSFTSRKQDILSFDSFKNNYEKPDPNAVREIILLINQLQERLLKF